MVKMLSIRVRRNTFSTVGVRPASSSTRSGPRSFFTATIAPLSRAADPEAASVASPLNVQSFDQVRTGWPAASVVGGAGSTFIGLMLACLTVLGTFYDTRIGTHHVMLAPLCILAVPLYDITSVILIRVLSSASKEDAVIRCPAGRRRATAWQPASRR